MKTLIYTCLSVLTVAGVSCKGPQADPIANPPVVANWVNVDSLFGLTDHQTLDVYADSSGIIVMTKNGLTFWPKGTKQPVSYNYPHYDNPGHAFYKGCAYVVTAENTITVIPYARLGDRPFTLTLDELALPPAQFSSAHNTETFVINSTGQMLILLRAKANAYEYLYTIQLDASGHPIRNTGGSKIGNQVPLPLDPTFDDNYFGLYYSDDQLYCSVYRNYNGDHRIIGWLNELQQITPDNQLQTALPRLSTLNLIHLNNALYAVTAPSDSSSYRIYKSTDHGITWNQGIKLLDSDDYVNYTHQFSRFHQIANRLTAINLNYYLLEFDLEKDQVKKLRLTGVTDASRDLNGLAEYDGYVYLTTSLGGVYRKPVKDFWQYEEY